MIKIWIDDVRTPPSKNWVWIKSTNEALRFIINHINEIEEVALDHDAGDYVNQGGDYINILNELERLSRKTPSTFIGCKFSIHTANPVGAANMRRIIQKNGWREIR